MKKIIIFLAVFLYASNLVNVNFFPQNKILDILFSLDSKFNGKVINTAKNQFLITDVKSIEEFNKHFKNFFVKDVQIIPEQNGVLIKFDTNVKYKTSVALTPDGYGLRFRIRDIQKVIQNTNINNSGINLGINNNPENTLDYFTYIISLAILIILAIILWVFRKKLSKKLPVKNGVNILFQKPLDTKNRVVLIEFNNRKYLVIVGNSNILLDIFDENMINVSTKNDFDNFLNTEINEKLDNLQNYIKNAEKLKEFDERF